MIAGTFTACTDDFSDSEVNIQRQDIQATDGNAEGDPDGGDGGYGGGTATGS